MTSLTTHIPLLDILIVIGTGGLATTGLTILFDQLTKKRAEFIELSKYKIDTISKHRHLYIQLAQDYYELARALGKPEKVKEDWRAPDPGYVFFYLCRILYYRTIVSKEIGALQFDSILAEDLVDELGGGVLNDLVLKLSREEVSIIAYIVDDGTSYDSFATFELPRFCEIYRKINKRIEDMKKEKDKIKDLANRASCYNGLVSLELSYLYRIWYRERGLHKSLYRIWYREAGLPLREEDEETIDFLLNKFLSEKYREYYDKRLKSRYPELKRKMRKTNSRPTDEEAGP